MFQHFHINNAALTVALALAAGVFAQGLARHLRLPGIVLLLALGVLLGPDVLNVVRPELLGNGLEMLVGFAVAVILFEGGLNLNLKRLAHQASVVRKLLTIGALISAAGSAAAAHYLLHWDWRWASLFGTLMIVTGPTVVTPLLRRIKVRHHLETILEAEGVLIDALGAVLAAVLLQIVIAPPTGGSLAFGALDAIGRLTVGAVLGLVGGLLIHFFLRFRHVVPEGLENIFTLSLVLALFQVSNAIMEESGIMTVAAAGIVMGNVHTRVQRELIEFKEQLTVMLIGMLFVLLAADVRVDDVRALGREGLIVLGLMMFVVRPVNIFASTIGSSLTLREKIFLSWIAPRGIVAAAVASLFADALAHNNVPDIGPQLRALVFLVIAGTVTVQGLTGGLLARALNLRRPRNQGVAILGANELGLTIGRLLRDGGEEVLFLDSNPGLIRKVEEDGFKAIFGNAMESRTLQRARIEERSAFIACVINEEVSVLVGRKVKEEFSGPRVGLGIRRAQSGIDAQMIHAMDAVVLFGGARDLELWALRLRRGTAPLERWRYTGPGNDSKDTPFGVPQNTMLPLIVERPKECSVVHDRTRLKKDDVVVFAVFNELQEKSHAWLREQGWEQVSPAEPPS